jgi:Fe-S cluster assembly iron-binding protein IscA
MTVADDIGFGLKVCNSPGPRFDLRVAEAAAVLGLTDLLGPRHRIAMRWRRWRDRVDRHWMGFPRTMKRSAVFELTSRAAAALAEARATRGFGDRIAVRICASKPDRGSSGGYKLRFATEPFPDDEVIHSAGATVFLAAGVADRLVATVLDAEQTAHGQKLVLKQRPRL